MIATKCLLCAELSTSSTACTISLHPLRYSAGEYHFREETKAQGCDVAGWSESFLLSFVYNELDIHDQTKVPCMSHQVTQETSTHPSIQKWGGQDLRGDISKRVSELVPFPT